MHTLDVVERDRIMAALLRVWPEYTEDVAHYETEHADAGVLVSVWCNVEHALVTRLYLERSSGVVYRVPYRIVSAAEMAGALADPEHRSGLVAA